MRGERVFYFNILRKKLLIKEESVRYFKTITIFFYLLTPFLNTFSQKNSLLLQPVNNPNLQQYNIRHINIGADGKLWLSTDNGLLSFDGTDIKAYQHRDEDLFSLSSNNILKTYTDSKGNLFIIESPQLIDYLDVKTGKVTALQIGIKGEDLRIMGQETDYSELTVDDESIWIAAYYVGFSQFNVQTRKTYTYYLHGEYLGKNTVFTIKKDITNKNLLWLGTENGIYSFNKTTKKVKRNFRCINTSDSSIADLQVTNMDMINSDTIWFTVPAKGVGCYEIKRGVYTMYPYINKGEGQKIAGIDIVGIQKRNKDDYFIATKNSLPGVFNTITHEYDFKVFDSQNLPTVLLNHFLIDSAGNFFAALYNRLYVAYSSRNKFSTIVLYDYTKETGKENFFKNIVWDNQRKFYYAALEKSNKVFVLDSNLNFLKSIPIAASPNEVTQRSIYDLGIDSQDRLWVCGTTLYLYDDASQKLIPSNKLYSKLLFKEQWFQNLQFRNDYIYLQPANDAYRAIYRINLKRMDYDSIPLPKEMVKDNSSNNYQQIRRLDFLAMDKEGKNTYWGYFRKSFFGYIYALMQYNIETLKARRISYPPLINPPNSNHLFPYALDDSDRLWTAEDTDFSVYEPVKGKLVKHIYVDETAATFCGPMCNAEGESLMCMLYHNGVLLYDYKNNKKYKLTLNDGLVSYLNSGIAVANNLLFTGTANYIQYISLAAVIGKPNPYRECYLSSVQVLNQPYQTDTLPQFLHKLILPYNENFLSLTFSSTEFEQPEKLEYRYMLDGVDKNWVYVSALNRTISYNDLRPGNYVFHASIKNDNGDWGDDSINFSITIIPAWWQTILFKILLTLAAAMGILLFIMWRARAIRKQEQLKSKYAKGLFELEAKALRAQMNPHFIFNCMNSIKSLVQQNEKQKAVIYLTTFSKLIRTVFQNSDKREISLFDELETCHLYTQLESMRFGDKFNYMFNIDTTLDLKSVKVPALIIQPFIENAIWHGIMPKENGGTVTVSVDSSNNRFHCIIDDDGIGREMSKQNKFKEASSVHESKGVHLTQARLDLNNILNQGNITLEIIDKTGAQGKPSGTTVILTVSEY
ncbi:MAG: histidine kinase [Ginsengibacter sp.]